MAKRLDLANRPRHVMLAHMAFIGDDPDLIDARAPRRWRLRPLVRAVLDLVLPPLCPVCSSRVLEPASLCPDCWQDLAFIERPFCDKTATPFETDLGPGALSAEAHQHPPPWQRARAAVLYGRVAGALVKSLKYGDRHEVARLMARLMTRAGRDVLDAADIVVPVPLHRARLWSRRFNQAAVLAGLVGKAAGKPVVMDLLVRRKATPQQVGLDRDKRARNMVGAFAVPSHLAPRLKGRRVLLVDDVYTSGATLAAATRVLKRGGAASVDVLVFARVTERIAADAAEPI
jgi:ComF family protein